MKKRGQQRLTNEKQKMITKVMSYFGKSNMRTKSDALWDKTKSNVARMADQMVGFKSECDFGMRTMKFVQAQALADGLSVAARESLKTTMLAYTDLIGKPEIRKAIEKTENADIDIKRSAAERIKPQFHTSWDERIAIQGRIEAKDTASGIAAAMSLYSGFRFEESLANCHFLLKDEKGQLYTSFRAEPGGPLRAVNIKQVRYAFTENAKDKAFETDYIATMRPGMLYVVGTQSWDKLDRARLVPVFDEAQKEAAIKAQTFILENKQHARDAGGLASRIKSVISPDRTRDQGKDHHEYILRACGLTKKDAGFSGHADRTEFCQRMKNLSVGSPMPSLPLPSGAPSNFGKAIDTPFTNPERSLAMGHGGDRSLAQYGG